MEIPDLQQSHTFQSCDIGAVTLDGTLHCGGPFSPVQAILPPGHVYACHQAFQVPLPGTDSDLIKIVHVEDNFPLWRSIKAKVVQVRVAIDDHGNSADG